MEQRICPNCGTLCQAGDDVCVRCGTIFAVVTTVLSPETSPHDRVLQKVCPNCATPCRNEDAVCEHCGLVLSTSSSVPSAGAILRGRYEMGEMIHAGGMGNVYLAKDRNLFDRPCVVKRVKERITSGEHRKKLEEEALRMARLSHPRIAIIFDHFVEDGYYFLVMEYVRGKTLSQVFKEQGGRLTEDEVVGWAVSVCEVVGYLHEEGVVHRDISPDNIMLTDEGDVKFIDFGTLRELRYIAAGQTAGMGKYGYAPPEQWQGKPEPRSDIFALGATMYYLLTGFLPLSDSYQTHQTPQGDDLNPRFPPIRTRNPAITRSLEAVLSKALELDVESRYPSADKMREALMLLNQANSKRKHHVRTKKPGQKIYHRWLVYSLAALALVMIGTGIFFVILAITG